MKYGKSSAWKTIMASKITMVCLLLLFVVLAQATWGISRKAALSMVRLSQAEAELAKLEQREKGLSNRIAYLSTDQGIEAELRTKYRAIKAGESVAVIVDQNKQTASVSMPAPVAAPQSEETKGWFFILLQKLGF